MNKIFKYLFAINLAFFILSFSFFITISMRSTYKLTTPNIKEYSYNLDKNTMEKNYNILMDYLTNKKIEKLEFITLPMSNEGRIHFMDVKSIFIKLLSALPIVTLILVMAFFVGYKFKDFSFIKLGTIFTLIIPLFIGIPMVINFDKTFILFHKIMFSNDYWMFNPDLDPIIDYLPESLFFLNGMMIIILVIILLLIFSYIYKKLSIKFKSNK